MTLVSVPEWTLEDVDRCIDSCMRLEVSNQVGVGYWLWYLREHKLVDDYLAYAEEHYGMKRSAVFMYIKVCEVFSVKDEDGKPTSNLKDEFFNYSISQLYEMRHATVEELDRINPEMTVKELKMMFTVSAPEEEPAEEPEEHLKEEAGNKKAADKKKLNLSKCAAAFYRYKLGKGRKFVSSGDAAGLKVYLNNMNRTYWGGTCGDYYVSRLSSYKIEFTDDFRRTLEVTVTVLVKELLRMQCCGEFDEFEKKDKPAEVLPEVKDVLQDPMLQNYEFVKNCTVITKAKEIVGLYKHVVKYLEQGCKLRIQLYKPTGLELQEDD